ncbi:hypothetical protein E2A64_10070 [Pseudohoeflea suaedae]|uniref:Uncharacterized protein n=1 Tax=Pseudohoeflea suaedae TaxID=877384 RepID=A0A4R5PJ49_9HYPH|nr:hypothetical protein [Pseudohoeflea suaedae]TDH35677.1 hypothetical protein E2A64_10070 [Pseudohoeflea suaedae]
MHDIPKDTNGLRLCKMVGDDLVMCEPVQFVGGGAAVDTVLRRASISGNVGPVGDTGDYWADLLNAEGDWTETIKLDRHSYAAIKTKWARCKIDRAA